MLEFFWKHECFELVQVLNIASAHDGKVDIDKGVT